MITMKLASELQAGDVFSTDGYLVQSACALADGQISVSLALAGEQKHAVLAADAECPIWTADGPHLVLNITTPDGELLERVTVPVTDDKLYPIGRGVERTSCLLDIELAARTLQARTAEPITAQTVADVFTDIAGEIG